MKLMISFILVLTSLTVLASEAQDRAMIEATIKAAKLISDANRSCDSHADCSHVAIGSKACGGPRTFMSISKKNTELATIEQLAERSVELESAFNSTYGVVSDCLATMPPAAYCQAKVCI